MLSSHSHSHYGICHGRALNRHMCVCDCIYLCVCARVCVWVCVWERENERKREREREREREKESGRESVTTAVGVDVLRGEFLRYSNTSDWLVGISLERLIGSLCLTTASHFKAAYSDSALLWTALRHSCSLSLSLYLSLSLSLSSHADKVSGPHNDM